MLELMDIAADLVCDVMEDFNLDEIVEMLEIPPNPEMGEVAFPCFKLSKTLRKAPPAIALELSEKITPKGVIKEVKAMGGYLNFYVDREIYIDNVMSHISSQGSDYGSENIGEGKTICIDYSAPNIAKPFHVGHLFTTVIGNSLYKIFKFMGYKVVGINHLGDWGTQFGKLIVAYKRWGNYDKVVEGQVKELVNLYIRFHEEAEKEPSLGDEARAWFSRLEKGDKEAKELWQWFVDLSIKEFQKVYKLLDIEFDSYAGESFYNDKMEPIISELEEKDLLKESQGAKIVDLESYGMPPCLLLKKDGSTLYATRDIAAGFYRKEKYNFHKCLYVMGASQALHLKQWTKVVELMGYEWAKDCIHVPFGMVSIEGKRLATRKGVIVLLEDLFNEAISRTLEIIKEKSPDMTNKEETATQIGVGAVVFGYLYSNRIKDISFSWDEALNFDGETGPYVQYTHARICSVLAKIQGDDSYEFDAKLMKTKEEFELIKLLANFGNVIKQAMKDYEPSCITRYLVDVAQAFNRFYHEHKIHVEDESLKNSRLALVEAARITLKNGLYLIGLKSPERV